VNSETLQGQREGVDQLCIPPYANIHDSSCCIRDEINIYMLIQGDIGYFNCVVKQGDAPVAIDHSLFAQTEDVLG